MTDYAGITAREYVEACVRAEKAEARIRQLEADIEEKQLTARSVITQNLRQAAELIWLNKVIVRRNAKIARLKEALSTDPTGAKLLACRDALEIMSRYPGIREYVGTNLHDRALAALDGDSHE